MNQIWLALITGITTGGISCIAVQGGLLASSMAQDEQELTRNQKMKYVGTFLLAKIVAYSILGFILGTLGSSLIISPSLQGWFQILAGLFMLITAGRLLNVHPIFRYFVIQPPKAIYRLMKNQSKSDSVFAPIILGAMTIFIPCGVTQAMLVFTVTTANPLLGSAIMFAFTLGTSPVFFAIGVAALEVLKRKSFAYIAACVILILGIISINTGQALRGSVHTFQNYAKAVFNNNSSSQTLGIMATKNADGKQEVIITASSNGYTSQTTTLRANEPVKLTLVSNNVKSCAKSFMIPSLGISKILPENGSETIEFTPTKSGVLAYTCGMGMYTGRFTVI